MAKDSDDKAPRGKIGELRMLWGFARGYPLQIMAAALGLVVAAGSTLAIPRGFQMVIDKGFIASGGDVAPYFRYLLLIVAIMALGTAFRFYFVSWIGERVVADIRIAVQANLLRLAPRFFEENRPSEIASRLTADTAIIEQVVGTTVSVTLRNVVLAIGCVIYLFSIAPKLAAMLLIGIPLVLTPVLVMGRRLRGLSRSSQDRIADVGAMIAEVLGAMKIVQAFGQEKREAERFGTVVASTFGTAKRRILMRAIMTAAIMGLIFGSITMVMWQGAIDVAAGRLSGGSIAAFIITGGLMAGAFGALAEAYGDMVRGAGAAMRLSELLHAEPEIHAPAHPVALPVPAVGTLAFDHVTFRYPTRPEVKALDDFSLSIAPGEMVAVVGPSGAGKSTLLQLAQRFYDPEGGAIRLDAVALPDADPAAIRARLAIVPQETVIFGASARDNLRYGRWDASEDDIWKAAEAANAASFLRAMPQGLDTFLGEGGARLSGGQRQRLAIARALLRDAPLLLLDEATSALDAESERLVQDALDRLMANRTTIVIAHRLATVRAADRIIVMDQGRIVEEGTHASLTAREGLYARLARLQFSDMAA
ncbi:ABC transporter transmembrane domain-containing protein [Sphingomonas crocodyli]|uniref:ATP-binding cassette domain-containing protein n=1 Tax=Sphingomonas crocodyli TaxID=1979270 RepID=A0A437M8A4_9SPHN|nr:ABC transporter transmembrane domain-containing protein [Sphingomonas crocodyli]RVT93941.1 ATP-binding cassette domain-containing protein [Sphingomonas crocodyli]